MSQMLGLTTKGYREKRNCHLILRWRCIRIGSGRKVSYGGGIGRQRPGSSKSVQRGSRPTTAASNGWLSRASSTQSHDWNLSVDSEVATVGSVETDESRNSSAEEKRSYAVFSSFSCDDSVSDQLHADDAAHLRMTPEKEHDVLAETGSCRSSFVCPYFGP